MLFNKKIEPCCAYCANGSRISETEVACLKRGVVSAGGSCRKFAYDPLKRVPSRPAPVDTEKFTAEDFEL